MTARHTLGENVEIRENEAGEAVIEHTESGETARVTEDGFVVESATVSNPPENETDAARKAEVDSVSGYGN